VALIGPAKLALPLLRQPASVIGKSSAITTFRYV
jgi:hypothetical protein